VLETVRIAYHWGIRKSIEIPYLPYGIGIEVTNRCNFKCRFCAQSRPTHFDKVQATALTVEQADVLLRKVRESGFSKNVIHWTHDGEPFMNKQFAKIIERSIHYGFDTHHFSTNGLLMTPDRLRSLPANGQRYFILPDFCSDPQLFESQRGTPGSWEKVRDNIRGAISSPDLSHINFVVHDISGFVVSDPEDLATRFEALKALFQESKRLVFKKRLFHNAAGLVEEAGKADSKSGYHLCFYPWYGMSIASNGEVLACGRDLEHQTVLGNLFEESLADIWNGDRYQSIRHDLIDEQPYLQAACAGCSMPFDSSKFSIRNIVNTLSNRMLVWKA